MSIKNYLKGLARDIELLENNKDFRAAQVLHEKFIRVANFPHRKDELMDDSFINADRYEEDMDLYDQANEDYYGELKDNPDEDIVDDSLASDLDVNEMNLTDDEDMDHEEIYGLFNTLRSKLGEDPHATKLLDQLESLYDSSVMGKR
jgi:tetratricopeptide (TPR) repeat protein